MHKGSQHRGLASGITTLNYPRPRIKRANIELLQHSIVLNAITRLHPLANLFIPTTTTTTTMMTTTTTMMTTTTAAAGGGGGGGGDDTTLVSWRASCHAASRATLFVPIYPFAVSVLGVWLGEWGSGDGTKLNRQQDN